MSKEELEKKSMSALLRIASAWYDQMKAGEIPSISLPTRTKYNIEYDDASEVWKYGDKESMRTADSAKSATHLLKMAYVIGFIKQQLIENRSSTLREMYYISEGWKRAKFGAQEESNFLIEDLEIISEVPREVFHLHPEENGASIYGPMRIREETRRGMRAIHCQDDVGQAGYTIPNNVENIEFVDHDAKFVIALETGGMYDRLIENGFDEEHNAILVHLKGQPARSTRRMLNKISSTWNLPVMVFTDGDPWSYRIFASVAYGSIKSAHMSELLATPKAQFLGLQPSDIRDYNLPSDKLSDKDVEALHAELTDPRFATEYWKKQINLQISLGLKSEQQAFAARGLDFVTKTYLPARLSEMGIIQRIMEPYTLGLFANMYPAYDGDYRGIFIQQMVRDLESRGVTVKKAVKISPSVTGYIPFYWQSLLLARDTSPDILQAEYIPHSSLIPAIVRRRDVPLVLKFHGDDGRIYPFKNPLFMALTRAMIRHSDYVLTSSEEIRTTLISIGAQLEKSATVHNGVDTDFFHPVAEQPLRKELGLSENLVVLCSSAGYIHGRDWLK